MGIFEHQTKQNLNLARGWKMSAFRFHNWFPKNQLISVFMLNASDTFDKSIILSGNVIGHKICSAFSIITAEGEICL
jgi:hypothetical protein